MTLFNSLTYIPIEKSSLQLDTQQSYFDRWEKSFDKFCRSVD